MMLSARGPRSKMSPTTCSLSTARFLMSPAREAMKLSMPAVVIRDSMMAS